MLIRTFASLAYNLYIRITIIIRGKFIVIEGIDGSGKSVQAKLLFNRFKKEKRKVRFIKFPQYEKNYWGGIVAKYLRGEFSKTVSNNAYLPSMFYALDRWESVKKISSWLKNGYNVICDRYADSNKVHQLTKIKNKKEKIFMEKWLDSLEYDILKIPRPDIVIYLDMPIKFAFKLSGNRSRKYIGRKKDILEADIEHLRNARKIGLDLCKKYEHFMKIDSVESGKLLSLEEIHKTIWSFLKI